MGNALLWLGLSVLAIALMWVPYILNAFRRWGLVGTMGYAQDLPPLADWAVRAKRAHANAVENLVLFAPLVVALASLGHVDGAIATAAMVFFVARVAHYGLYTGRVPFLRTLTFLGGWGATVFLAVELLRSVA